MSAFSFLTALFLGTSNIAHGADIVCSQTDECAGQTLNFDDVFCTGTTSCRNTSITATDDINCDGFKSCIENEMFADDDVNCNGFKSCYNSEVKRANNLHCRGNEACNIGVANDGRVNGNLECLSHRSCAFAQNIFAGRDIICSGPRSCIGGTFFALDDIICDGSYSCASAEKNGFYFESQISSSDDIYCRGWFSCEAADMAAPNDVRCDGAWSCKDTEFGAGDEVSCDGRFSCQNARIIFGAKELHCYGQNSCEYARIEGVVKIEAFGFRSLHDAMIFNRETINIPTTQTMIVEVKGHQAGDGASIYCYDDDIPGNDCEIICQGNGCNGLTVYCQPNASCAIDCTNADCPITQTF